MPTRDRPPHRKCHGQHTLNPRWWELSQTPVVNPKLYTGFLVQSRIRAVPITVILFCSMATIRPVAGQDQGVTGATNIGVAPHDRAGPPVRLTTKGKVTDP